MLTDLRDYLHRAGRINVHPDQLPVDVPWVNQTAQSNWLIIAMIIPLVVASGLLVWATGEAYFSAIGVFGPAVLYFLTLLNPKGVFDFIYRRSHMRLDAGGVEFAITAKDGSVRRERAPWSEYTAVHRSNDSWTTTLRTSSEVKHNYYVASVIEIVHPQSEKTIPVFFGDVRSQDGMGGAPAAGDAPRDLWEAWARTLGLPASESGRSRAPETLDMSLKEKVERGIEAGHWTDAHDPPPDLTVSRTVVDGEDGFEILMPRAGKIDIILLISVGLGAALMLGGIALWALVHRGAGIGLICAGLVFVAFGVMAMLVDFRPRRLLLTRSEIEIKGGRPITSAKSGRVALEDIEDVRTRGGVDQRSVAIVTDSGQIHTGALRAATAAWLCDFLIAAIASA